MNDEFANGPRNRARMTGWYNPGLLFDTAIKTIFSDIIGKYSDPRLVGALSAPRKEYYDYTFHYTDSGDDCEIDHNRPRSELWLDYTADLADGWNSTYGIAYTLSQPRLSVGLRGAKTKYETQQGAVLIFGGDEIYPTPSRDAYRKKLILPYEAASGNAHPEERPHLFAVPGNHDWYDGLSAFTRLFCSDIKRTFAGWLTRQHRSYFALKLPHHWWLFGSDGQLRSNLDTPQIEYFRFIADKYMQEGDQVILCTAQPVWIYAHKYKQYGAEFDEADLLYLQHDVLSKKKIDIKVFLAGDLHHYRRHEEKLDAPDSAKTQKITSGGGGAFLHPTHGTDVSRIHEEKYGTEHPARTFELKKSFPEIEESKRLAWRNLLFFWINPWFGVVPGLIYFLTAWILWSSQGYQATGTLLGSIKSVAFAARNNPGVALWVLMFVFVFVFFTDTHSKFYKWAGGLAHCLAHYACIFLIAWAVQVYSVNLASHHPLIQFAISGSIVFTLGWLAGSEIVGIYLLISLNVWGRHDNEAFSALKIEDYKNFLRLHIAEDGSLTIFPVKIRRVPRLWQKRRETDTGTASLYIPADGTQPELIEEPIRLES